MDQVKNALTYLKCQQLGSTGADNDLGPLMVG